MRTQQLSVTAILLLSLGLGACGEPDPELCNDGIDNDGDALFGDAAVRPGATELCNGVDDDCDDEVDEEAADAATWYADDDSDGYGDAGSTTEACETPSGYTDDATDCDDGDGAIHPDAAETCNGADDDCDGLVDDEDPRVTGTSTWYLDYDADGYGAASAYDLETCEQPSGYADNAEDCDDNDANISPSGVELCDGVDNDCDGNIDEDDADDAGTWYLDSDSDGYGDGGSTAEACEIPTNYVDDATDCDDSDADVYPGSHATEIPYDGVDQDCDGNDYCLDPNCDGWPDLLFSNARNEYGGNQEAYLYYGSETGFAASPDLELDAYASAGVLMSHLDDDGYPDLVVCNGGTSDAYVYWGSDSGYGSADRSDLAAYGTRGVSVGDLDGDTYPDLVFGGGEDDGDYEVSSYIYWGTSSGYIDSPSTVTELDTLGAQGTAVADLDGDGCEDVVFANMRDNSQYALSSYVYFGSCSRDAGTFTLLELDTTDAQQVVATDLDNDGWLDLAFAQIVDNSNDYTIGVRIHWNDGAGGFDPTPTDLPGQGTAGLAAADLNGDGWLDLALANYTDGTGSYEIDSYVYWGSATGFDVADRDLFPTSGAHGVTTADLDLDGDLELIFANYQDDESTLALDSVIYDGSATGPTTAIYDSVPTVAAGRVTAGLE